MSLKSHLVFFRTRNALDMFSRAIKRLEASNKLAKQIIEEHEKKITKLAANKEKVSNTISTNDRVIKNISTILQG